MRAVQQGDDRQTDKELSDFHFGFGDEHFSRWTMMRLMEIVVSAQRLYAFSFFPTRHTLWFFHCTICARYLILVRDVFLSVLIYLSLM